jgi:hypothetical protein
VNTHIPSRKRAARRLYAPTPGPVE